jgi:hypothetical protein
MTITQHLQSFAGLPVVPFEGGGGSARGISGTVAHRLALEYDDKHTFPELLDLYLAEPGAEATTALVVGAWGEEMFSGNNSQAVEALVAARGRLPQLRALFLGDITYEECEISWIHQGDVSPLLTAYPNLQEFRVRGVQELTFGRLRHPNSRMLAIESGGLPEEVLQEVWAAELPKLEYLELWLGTVHYGGIDTIAPLEPLLSGRLFPRLQYLGLRDSDIADQVAQAAANSSLLERIRILDLSLGNLSDEGATALIDSPAVRRLQKLDIHHHYVSEWVTTSLHGLGIEIDAGDAQDPQGQGGADDRYNAVSE